MVNISPHFSRHEYACDCGNQGKKREDGYCGGDFACVDKILNESHEKIRERLGVVFGETVYVSLSGGNRCPKHNEDIGGADRSYHKRGMGSDLQFKFKSGKPDIAICYDAIDNMFPGKYGVKLYSSWVHFDVRSVMWRDK